MVASPPRISPPPEHCFLYEQCTIPPGVTLDEWRRAPRGRRRPARRRPAAWVARVIGQ
jgi:hypothetical protein